MYFKILFFVCASTIRVVAIGQMVGIGTNAPLSTLDVAGRIHFKHNGQKTPGIYFDGSTGPNRGFIGHVDENHIGLFGTGGGWTLAMNFNNGHTGIGHSQPTATLDVAGSIRLRLPAAAVANTLTSTDASGNAQWTRPVAFKVAGAPNPDDESTFTKLPNGQWVKPAFSNISEYNIGLSWEPINQVFVVPVRGLYHFDGHFQTSSSSAEIACRIVLTRNNVDSDLFTTFNLYKVGSTLLGGYQSLDFSTDVRLEAGDRIRVELRGAGNNFNPIITPAPSDMFFSGRLITPL
jgi:hypothetical protein